MLTKETIEKLDELATAGQNYELSYGEIVWLQNNKQAVLEYGNMELAQWADITEEEWNNKGE